MSENLPENSPLPEYILEPNIDMPKEYIQLLVEACRGFGTVHIVRQFDGGKSGAVSCLFKCAGRPYEVAKFDHPNRLTPEFEAYTKYVASVEVPEQHRVVLRGGLHTSLDGTLGLIIYNFLGDSNLRSSRGKEDSEDANFQHFFEMHNGTIAGETLERLILNHDSWRDHPHFKRGDLAYDEEYDRLLPVSLYLERIFDPQTTPTITLTSGTIQWKLINSLQVNQIVALEEFEITDTRGEILRLRGLSPEKEKSTYVRVKLDKMELDRYQPGDRIPPITAKIVATRRELLEEFVHETDTVVRNNGEIIDIHGKRHPNPLNSVNTILGTRLVRSQFSIIHGDLNMRNIMVDPKTRAAWLIDFADTRIGPTLFDFQRLEEHVISLLLVPLMEKHTINPNFIVDILNALHTNEFGIINKIRFYRLREPIILLRKIRQLAKEYLIPTEDWTEYYRGLFLVFVGALKYERNIYQRETLLICAATAKFYIDPPQLPKTVYEPKDVMTMTKLLFAALIGAVITIVAGAAIIYVLRDILPPRIVPEIQTPTLEPDPEGTIAALKATLTRQGSQPTLENTATPMIMNTPMPTASATPTRTQQSGVAQSPSASALGYPCESSSPVNSEDLQFNGQTLKVGVVVSDVGRNALLGDAQRLGTELAQTCFSKLLLSYSITLEIVLPDPEKTTVLEQFHDLIDKDAIAIIGPTYSSEAEIILHDRKVDESDVIIIGPSNTADGIAAMLDSNLRVSAPVKDYARFTVTRVVSRHNIQSAALLYRANDLFTLSEQAAYGKALEEPNVEISLEITRTFTNALDDYSSIATEIISNEPEIDLVIISGKPEDAEIVNQLKERNYSGQIIIGNGLNTPGIFNICRENCTDVYIAYAYDPELDNSSNRTLVNLYRDNENKGDFADPDYPTQITAQMFTAFQVLTDATIRVQKDDAESSNDIIGLRAALLQAILNKPYDNTPLGPIKIDNEGEISQNVFCAVQLEYTESLNASDGSIGKFKRNWCRQ